MSTDLLDPVLLRTDFPDLKLRASGKVRDVYDISDDTLLFVASDRISAFDYVLATGIPHKGRVLSQISLFWFDYLADIVPNHLVTAEVDKYPANVRKYADQLRGRSMLVRKTTPLSLECVARGYLAGSGWKEYVATGQVCGIKLPAGLVESDKLPEPIFTPATKASSGHDVNISEAEAAEVVGTSVVKKLRDLTLRLYVEGASHARTCGIIVADTKFEFGLLPDDHLSQERLILIDEVLTPDSSRFWPADEYMPGRPQPSFDKQFVRDYLERIRWNKQPPVPSLPDDIVASTRDRYLEAYQRLTGGSLA